VDRRRQRLTETEREHEVLEPIAKGRTNREIAQELKIKAKTVGNHVSSILGKLNVTSRTEAALWVVKEGFIDQARGVTLVGATRRRRAPPQRVSFTRVTTSPMMATNMPLVEITRPRLLANGISTMTSGVHKVSSPDDIARY
jgi:DNA-binding CsgD family transcriptional regulator